MIQSIKSVLKKTPVYTVYRKYREAEELQQLSKGILEWTQEDDHMMEFYRQFVNPGDTVFDVGANLGNRTKVFLKLGAKVVAVEPQKRCGDFLEQTFGTNPNFRLVRKALGPKPGQAEINICPESTVTSLSQQWIEAVKESGRFGGYQWDRKEVIQMDTLDNLIASHGSPAFMKIDVEGFEYEVLSGLSRPVKAMSLEFIPEYLENTFNCIDHVSKISPARFQISLGESLSFHFPEWIGEDQIKPRLSAVDAKAFGDLYIRTGD
ncbi:hypothetical protein GMSM_20670 [Geomonas sp. Red276]